MKDISPLNRVIAVDDALDRAEIATVAALGTISQLLPPTGDSDAILEMTRRASHTIALARAKLAETTGATQYSRTPTSKRI